MQVRLQTEVGAVVPGQVFLMVPYLLSIFALVIAATPGRHDAPRVREALAFNAQVAGGRVLPETLGLSSITRRMDDGRVTDADARADIAASLAGFASFVRTPPAEGAD